MQLHGESGIVGTTTLYRIDLDHRRAEVGIALGSRAWGRGYGREVLRLLIGLAFGELGLHRLETSTRTTRGHSPCSRARASSARASCANAGI